jgi:hypothetical protein
MKKNYAYLDWTGAAFEAYKNMLVAGGGCYFAFFAEDLRKKE